MSMKRRVVASLVPALVVLSFTAGAQAQGEEAIAIDGPSSLPMDTSLRLVSLLGSPVPVDITVTAVFGSDATISGMGGCNDYRANYGVDGLGLEVSPVFSTRMACPEDVMAIEDAYFDELADAESWSWLPTRGDLVVETSSGSELIFNDGRGGAVEGRDMHPLLRTSWTLESLPGQTIPEGIIATATFDADGYISGDAGCNQYSAEYMPVDREESGFGGGLSVTEVSATKRACEKSVMDAEQAFLQALATAEGWSITGDEMRLACCSGEHILFSAGGSSAGTASDTRDGSLAGTTWRFSTIAGEAMDLADPPTITFGDDGRVRGQGSCADFSGSYELDGESIRFSELDTAMKDCSDPMAIGVEQALLQTIPFLTRWQIDGAVLTLFGFVDELSMTFEEIKVTY